MGLDMKTKKLTEETAKRYCTASRKLKTKIIDEFTATTGYNRKYAIHLLKNTACIKVIECFWLYFYVSKYGGAFVPFGCLKIVKNLLGHPIDKYQI